MGSPPWFYCSRLSLLRDSGARPLPMDEGVCLKGEEARPPQLAWRAEHQAKEDYLWALRANGICPARIWTCLRSITHFFFLISPFWNRSVYSLPIPPLYFGSIRNLHSLLMRMQSGMATLEDIFTVSYNDLAIRCLSDLKTYVYTETNTSIR